MNHQAPPTKTFTCIDDFLSSCRRFWQTPSEASSPAVSLVAAMGKNRVIGRGLEIPWRIPGEQKIFRELTVGRTLILGRKTHESIGRPLPDRETIVVSRDPTFQAKGVRTAASLEQAMAIAHTLGRDIVIGGGGELYAQALPCAGTLYLTQVDASPEGDVYFPEIPAGMFAEVFVADIRAETPYRFVIMTRPKEATA